ncbi:MAG: glutamate--tRNA ligase [Patescibacteria group bacterium]|jgi:glutamyl-tRNA synthetase|nr:glutamate--tRNA ligase [Patescibacteria group bacterium]
MAKKITTRFAPSPTGFLHVGGLRTALYSYLFARHHGGNFLLRIEDTDQTRKVEGAAESLITTLEKFGLNRDNKKVVFQSERLEKYQTGAKKLVEASQAYYCFCSKDRLDNLRQLQTQKGLPPMYDGHCRNLTPAEIEEKITNNQEYVIRFKMPKTGQTEFIDLVRGKVTFDNKLLDDPIILKSDGFPTYHLASVIDDHDMEVTDVIRGEEWLPSTPKHLLLYKAFNWDKPNFAHLPLLLNSDRTKLSKRQGDVAVEDYLAKGYLPEALLNFVLLLGWNPGTDQEIFNLEEMIKTFAIDKINKSGAIFNVQKLDWLNGHYLRSKSPHQLAKLCEPYFSQAGINVKNKEINLEKVIASEQQRIKRLNEIVEATGFFFQLPDYETKLLVWKKSTGQATLKNLELIKIELEKIPANDWQTETLEKIITLFIKDNNYSIGDMLWPMRVALTGRQASPGNFEVAAILGKTESLNRIEMAIEKLQAKDLGNNLG